MKIYEIIYDDFLKNPELKVIEHKIIRYEYVKRKKYIQPGYRFVSDKKRIFREELEEILMLTGCLMWTTKLENVKRLKIEILKNAEENQMLKIDTANFNLNQIKEEISRLENGGE